RSRCSGPHPIETQAIATATMGKIRRFMAGRSVATPPLEIHPLACGSFSGASTEHDASEGVVHVPWPKLFAVRVEPADRHLIERAKQRLDRSVALSLEVTAEAIEEERRLGHAVTHLDSTRRTRDDVAALAD